MTGSWLPWFRKTDEVQVSRRPGRVVGQEAPSHCYAKNKVPRIQAYPEGSTIPLGTRRTGQYVQPLRAQRRTGAIRKRKKLMEEVLKISGIKYDRDICLKFDVFDNANNYETVTPAGREFIGSFTQLPHKHKHDI